jgi:hypothetical protein
MAEKDSKAEEDQEKKGDAPKDEDDTQDMTEKLPKGFAEKFAEMEAQNKALRQMSESQGQTIAAMAQAARTKQFTDEILGNTPESGLRWYGDAEKHVSMMESLHQAGLTDQLQQYIEGERAHASQLHESGLFAERGRSGGTAGSADDKLQGLIAAAQANGLSLAEATDKVMSENPNLYAEYSEAKSFRDGDN